MRLAIADGEQHALHTELIGAAESAARELGIEVERLGSAHREADYDAVLMLGYPHYYPAFELGPHAARRICWYGENLPHLPVTVGQRVARKLPSARLLDLAARALAPLISVRSRVRLLRLREQAAIERELGRNLAEIRRARSWMDDLVVVSGNRELGARIAGWTDVRRAPFGYHESMAGPIVAPSSAGRDIDVLFLGRDVDVRVRRARMLAEFRARLGDRARLVVVDRGYYGPERHALISRAKIVVDIHRLPWNSTGIRFVLATAGGAAMVNEVTVDEWLPDLERYAVEVPVDRLADAVVELLADEPRRRRLVEAGQDLLRTDLAMTTCVRSALGLAGPNSDHSAASAASNSATDRSSV